LRAHPFAMRYSATVNPIVDIMLDASRSLKLGVEAEIAIRELDRLPRPVDEWLVREQLRQNPQIEKLWR
jgi:hypothetical protein